MLAAMRRASSRVSKCAAARRHGSSHVALTRDGQGPCCGHKLSYIATLGTTLRSAWEVQLSTSSADNKAIVLRLIEEVLSNAVST
jgi:hypothetical protein